MRHACSGYGETERAGLRSEPVLGHPYFWWGLLVEVTQQIHADSFQNADFGVNGSESTPPLIIKDANRKCINRRFKNSHNLAMGDVIYQDDGS